MASINGAPDLSQVKAWLGLAPEDTEDDAVLQAALDASLSAQAQVVCYPADSFGECTFNPALTYAIFLRTQEAAARRNSPEGIVGITGTGGEFVGARIAPSDPDIARYEGPYLKTVVA